ncbi:MAG: sugar O-acetyltransferase [Lachnospiraceae bacterium]|nr:sugar O-acetyltransferase [Lachnospiraceae bacterium]MCD8014182.1 sugar O-acetyltransferase [Lachnospiraceae bacterium]
MDQKEKMFAGTWLDGLSVKRAICKQKIYSFNVIQPSEEKRVPQLLKDILGKTGKTIWIEPPFHCDYGWNIEVGENFFAHYNFAIWGVGKVTIGRNVLIAPNVSIYTAGHPVYVETCRLDCDYEYGNPVTIGNNVQIGGGTIILPGVTIGNNVIIEAGSVVGKNISENRIAAGNPCRIIRKMTEDDRTYYTKKRVFDIESRLGNAF